MICDFEQINHDWLCDYLNWLWNMSSWMGSDNMLNITKVDLSDVNGAYM